LKKSDFGELTLLAAIWGASFLFMRLGAAEFGPVALAAMRVIGATLVLLPVLMTSGKAADLKKHWKAIFIVGLTNSAIPFLCFGIAALSLSAGLLSIFNASTPLFGAVIAWVWLGDRLNASRVIGLAIGFVGVLWLAWNKASFHPGGSGWAVVACLVATLFYGLSANYTKRFLSGVAPLALATGSQLAAALVLIVPAAMYWPAVNPSLQAWVAVVLLAVLCSGIAYILYFRLIAHVGPANAISVTFLIPVFAVLWGFVFLGEGVTKTMVLGCLVIVAGTALATGMVKLPVRQKASV
jgi:drug/metabolite transporter (DMT)-like permease